MHNWQEDRYPTGSLSKMTPNRICANVTKNRFEAPPLAIEATGSPHSESVSIPLPTARL